MNRRAGVRATTVDYAAAIAPMPTNETINARPGTVEASDPLGVLADARARSGETLELAARHLDPSLVDVLGILGFDERYVTAEGSYVYDEDGRGYLDFHTGEGFASLGHNHPAVREALEATLAAGLIDGVQIHYSVLAGMLAEAICALLPDRLEAVFFTSAGAEAVDTAIKFARAATGRPRLVSCESSFHGVTLGPLSIVGDDFFKEGFGPLLPGCARVPFGDLGALERELRTGDVAAFIVEPIQGRMVTLPPDGYLAAAQELCRRHGTLFVVDEIQTGLGRTGRWFALEHWGLEPDVVLVGKALSGGYMPTAAMVTTREIFQKAVGTLERCYVHQSTYGRNRLSMAAGLAALRVIERDRLIENANAVGAVLRDGLRELQGRHEMLREVRASGLMIGIELGMPDGPCRAAQLAADPHGQRGPVPAARRDPAAPRPRRDHDGGGQERRDQAAAAADPLRGGGAKLPRGARRGARGLRRRRQLGRRARDRDLDPAPPLAPRPRVSGAPDRLVAVTGAGGFIGGRLAARLAREGRAVRCLARAQSDTSALDRLGLPGRPRGPARRGGARARAGGGEHRRALRRDGLRLGDGRARSRRSTSPAPRTCSARRARAVSRGSCT